MPISKTQQLVDRENADFWNELCASHFARRIGVNDFSRESLAKFDAAYLDLYPYLLHHVDLSSLAGRRILEVGLGWGTLGQKIVTAGAEYVGLDIAAGPVSLMQTRLNLIGLPGQVIQGSMLNCPLSNESVDGIVSIGCYHHTGSVQRCIEESYRILRPGGIAVVMVYNQFSYLQWLRWPVRTAQSLFSPAPASSAQRHEYDKNIAGAAAPETVFTSVGTLEAMFTGWREFNCVKENVSGTISLKLRKILLPNLGKVMGLDLYVTARK